MQEAAHNLVNALAEAVWVFEEQGRLAEEARQRANATQARFTSLLESYRAGANLEASADQGARLTEGIQGDRPWEASTGLSVRWERAFCDGYEALMRLYLHPQARAQAERVAALLRAVRLLQAEHDTPDLPPFSPSVPLEGIAAESPDERKRRMAGMALNFFGGMEGWHEKVQRGFQEKADQTGSLLRESLAEATALAEGCAA